MRLLADEEALAALVSLRANADFNVVMRNLGMYLEEKNKQLIYTKEVDRLPTIQGEVRGLADFIEAIHKAPERLDKLRQGAKE
jgi:hypothetical protein